MLAHVVLVAVAGLQFDPESARHQGEEGIAEKYGRMGSVGAVGGIAAVAGIGAIEDVIMDECSEVDQLDDAGTANQGVGRRAARAGAERE